MKLLLKKALRVLLHPVLADFERRFRRLQEYLDLSLGPDLRPHLDGRLDTLEHRVGWVEDRVDDRGRDVHDRLAHIETRVTTDTQTAAEFATSFRRATDQLRHQLGAVWELLTATTDPHLPNLLQQAMAGNDPEAEIELARLLRRLVPGAADRVVGEHAGIKLAELGPGGAEFLNWAQGHTGPSAQGNLWFNPPVSPLHQPGTVGYEVVTERIVEVPYVLSSAAALPPGARVLDFGASESTVSLSLASLGLEVFAADLHRYPISHPNLHAVTGPIQDWSGPDEPLDLILSLSTLEHVGLGAYGEERVDDDLQQRILDCFARWLGPGGELVLTAPYGRWQVTEQQRVYDAAHLDALLEGWELLDRRVHVQTAPDRWERVDGEPDPSVWDDGTAGVVLLRAAPGT